MTSNVGVSELSDQKFVGLVEVNQLKMITKCSEYYDGSIEKTISPRILK